MKTIVVTALAVICGISAVIGVSRWRDAQVTRAAAPVETVKVVVAAINIAPQEMVTRETLTLKDWPKNAVPEGSLLKVEDAVDQYAKGAILKGEPLGRAKLSVQPVGLTAKISSGMRAISVLTPKYSSSVAGLVLPGQSVDVLMTRKSGRSGVALAETLLQNVKVLAVDRQIRADLPGQKEADARKLVQSVTLEVTPPQAERLSIAQMEGEILLALRGANDEEIIEPPAPPAPPPAQNVFLTSMMEKVLQALAENAALRAELAAAEERAAAVPVAEPVPEPEPEPIKVEESKPIDIPVFTLRGNQWGYAIARQPVPRVPAPQPRASGD